MSLLLSQKFDIESIPVRNIWLLMAYAADASMALHKQGIESEEITDDLPELLAHLLCQEVDRRIRGHLSVGFQSRSSELSRLRGRVSHIETARRDSMARGKIYCTYEVLTHDTPENRLVRHALQSLLRHLTEKKTRELCASAAQRMGTLGVRAVSREEAVRSIRTFSPNKRDVKMVELSKLALNLDLPSEVLGPKSLLSTERKIEWLRKLYEKAVLGFYQLNLAPSGIKVGNSQLHWPVGEDSAGDLQWLPRMKTDIELEDKRRQTRVVIDTKFTMITKPGRHENETFSSGHMYQLYAYLRTQEVVGDSMSVSATGMLLHPATGTTVFEGYVVQGHRIIFATVDLMASSDEIRAELLAIAERCLR